MTKTEILNELKNLTTNKTRADWIYKEIHKMREDFEEFEDILTDRTEKIVTDVFEHDLGLDRDILEWAKIGKNYSEWLQRFKGKIILDEDIAKGEAMELLKISKCEIQTLRRNINAAKRSTTATKADINKMKKQLYVHKRLDEMNLDNTYKLRVKKILLEGDALKGLDEYHINRKIKELLKD